MAAAAPPPAQAAALLLPEIPNVEPLWQASTGRIDRIEVENFKSYRGHQHIGPFKAFTAVIGPNGSGKSNLMDAISFVLGVKTTQLRGSLKELLYSAGDGAAPGEADRPRRGFVKLVYVVPPDEDAGAGSGAAGREQEVQFMRAFQPSGSDPDAAYQSVYKINDRTVTWEAYAAKLGSFGILVKVRNFLVFQGDIEAVAAKSPQGLTQLFEQISGSEAYRLPFEQLAEAKARAEEKVSALYAKRKQVAAEAKAKKREKEEAEKHAKLLEELRALKADYVAWQLAVMGAELHDAMGEQARAEEELAALEGRSQNHDKKVDALRRQAAGFKKEVALLDKKIKKVQADKDKKAPALIKLREEVGRLVRAILKEEKGLADARARAAGSEKTMAEVGKQLALLDEEEAALAAEEEEHYAAYGGGKLQGAAQKEEYARLRAQAGAATQGQEGERRALAQEHQSESAQLEQLRSTVEALTARRAALQRQAEEEQTKADAQAGELADIKKELEGKRRARAKLAGECTRTTTQREHLTQRKMDVDARLEELRATRRESRRERQLSEMVDKLKAQFPGKVYGKLVHLAKVPNRRYQLALSVAMQRDLDSVVVDTEVTAHRCVEALRGASCPPINFLALNYIKVRPLSERLRGLGGTAKLAVDLLEVGDEQHYRAFLYALGNTVICDGDDEARKLAYGPERLKVVTAEGTLITTRGTMTGGSAPAEARGAKWDEAEAGKLAEEGAALAAELDALPSARALQEEDAALVQALQALQTKANFGEGNAKTLCAKVAGLKALQDNVAKELARKEADLAALSKRTAATAERLERVAASINQEVDRIFADFSRRVGVRSIREWEEQHQAFEADVAERRKSLNKKRSQASSQLEYLKAQLPQQRAAAEAAQRALEASRAAKTKAEGEVATAAEAAARADEEAAALAQQAEQMQEKVSAVEGEIHSLQAEASGLTSRTAALRRAVKLSADSVEGLAQGMRDVVSDARQDQVKLPQRHAKRKRDAAGDADEDDEDAEGGASGDGGDGGPEPMDLDEAAGQLLADEDEEAGAGAGPSGGGGGGQQRRAGALAAAMADLAARLDTSRLSRQQLAARSAREKEKAAGELRTRIDALGAELARSNPNMRALEQYEHVKEREREQLAALQAAQQDQSAATEAFTRVRTRRHDLFMAAFNHISEQINTIYKDLTRSSTHQLGGQAYLHLENEEEPHAGGIKYTAIPPAKRFRDMEQLSGGEKTVAALALLFALHSFRPSPFFVLDEVDAALDAANVARVAHYIRARTRGALGGGGEEEAEDGGGEGAGAAGGSFQSIVISLKDIFYEKADALVGVCRDLDRACSKTFMFDLSRFEEPAPDA